MFRHGACFREAFVSAPLPLMLANFVAGNDLYLVARRDPNAPYWNQNISDLPWMLQHDLNLAGCVCVESRVL
jgi:hypothetical protein